MENKEKVKETPSRGLDWEVVSLTASAYAASPGLHQFEQSDDTAEKGNESNDVEVEIAEASQAMIMSKHFIFPPTEHENLPLEPVLDSSDIHKDSGNKHIVPELNPDEKGKLDGKAEEGWDIRGLTSPYEFLGMHFYDEKSNNILIRGAKFEGSTVLQGFNLVDKEQDVYGATRFTSFHSKTTIGGSTEYDDAAMISNNTESSEQGLDMAGTPEPEKDDTFDEYNIPCEAWWKRQVASWYPSAKQTNSFYYVFVAAAVMGLVIIRQQWQQERSHLLKHNWQSSSGDANSGRFLGPLSRLKAIIVGGHGSSITASGSGDL